MFYENSVSHDRTRLTGQAARCCSNVRAYRSKMVPAFRNSSRTSFGTKKKKTTTERQPPKVIARRSRPTFSKNSLCWHPIRLAASRHANAASCTNNATLFFTLQTSADKRDKLAYKGFEVEAATTSSSMSRRAYGTNPFACCHASSSSCYIDLKYRRLVDTAPTKRS